MSRGCLQCPLSRSNQRWKDGYEQPLNITARADSQGPYTPTTLNPLPDNKILNLSKLKQNADDISKCI